MNGTKVYFLLLLLLTFFYNNAFALTYKTMLSNVLAGNTGITAMKTMVRSRAAAVPASAMWMNPSVGIEYSPSMGEWMISARIPVPDPFRTSAAHEQALRYSAYAFNDSQMVTLDIIMRAVTAYWNYWLAWNNTAWLTRAVDIMDKGLKYAAAMSMSGMDGQRGLLRMKSGAGRMRSMLNESRGRMQSLWSMLASYMGMPVLSEPQEPVYIDSDMVLPGLPEYMAALSNHPAFRMSLSREAIAQGNVSIAAMEWVPRLMLSGSYGSMGNTTVMMELELPLYFNRLAAEKTSMELMAQSQKEKEMQYRLDFTADAVKAWQDYKGMYEALAVFKKETLPAAESILRLSESSYTAGRTDFEGWVETASDAVEAGMQGNGMQAALQIMAGEIRFFMTDTNF